MHIKAFELVFLSFIIKEVTSQYVYDRWGHAVSCHDILNTECFYHGRDHLCGSNGITYENHCYLEQAFCDDPSIHLAHHGSCHRTLPTLLPATPTETVAPVTPDSVNYDENCIKVLNEPCESEVDPVCGSDGEWYLNMCELDKTTCLQPNITLEHGGLCNDQPESDMAV